MNTTPARKKSRIRQRNEGAILVAAEKVFAKRGFGAATTAEIAKRAGIPKANLHYYFNTKEDLYTQVLENILKTWLTAAQDFSEDQEPRAALEKYIRTKIELSRTRPEASKIFAKEIISGAPFLKDHLRNDINPWLAEKKRIFKSWINQGKMAPVDVCHLFFLIWSMTQTYADFSTQIEIVLDKNKLEKKDFQTAADTIVSMVFSHCNFN
jgi:TetR/AcrR family transcriptional regulator